MQKKKKVKGSVCLSFMVIYNQKEFSPGLVQNDKINRYKNYIINCLNKSLVGSMIDVLQSINSKSHLPLKQYNSINPIDLCSLQDHISKQYIGSIGTLECGSTCLLEIQSHFIKLTVADQFRSSRIYHT